MSLNDNPKVTNEILSLIRGVSIDCEIKKLLHSFVLKELQAPSYQIRLSTRNDRNIYCRSIKALIRYLNGFSIVNISWSYFCISLRDINNLEKCYNPLVNYLFREFIKYILKNTSKSNECIEILRNYIDYLDIPERPKIKYNVITSPLIIDKYYLNFSINSHPSKLYLYESIDQSKEKGIYKTLINLNTDDEFLKNLIISFIESLPKNTEDKRTARIPTTTIFRQFIYYFEYSLYGCNNDDDLLENKMKIINLSDKKYTSILDFNYRTFKKQFRFYSDIDKRFPVTNTYNKSYGTYRHTLTDLLKSFYIFIYNFALHNSILHDPFDGTGIDKSILAMSTFNTYYRDGFLFIKDTRLQDMPHRNKIAVVITENSNRSRAANQNIYSFDFTKVICKEHRENLKQYIWNVNCSLSRRNSNYLYITEFLNFKHKWNIEQKNVTLISPTSYFSEDFMFSFRLHVMNKYNDNSTMDGSVLAAKSFLKYYKTKYSVGDFAYVYLNCFERKRNGGRPIPDEDFNLLMNCFRKVRSESIKNELCFIVFYLCSTTKIRLGSILNLRRDCITNINEVDQTGTIKFYSKTSDRNYDSEIISLNCINFIKRAIKITEDISTRASTKFKDYIFIMKSTKIRNKYDGFNVIFLGAIYNKVFLDVQERAGLKNKYTPYQVRHTRKNKIYEEANKKGYSELEINEMIGGNLQVNLQNYIKFNNTKLYTEVFTQVTISNVDINGKIINDDSMIDSLNQTSSKIGNCEDASCKYEGITYSNIVDDTYKCLICSSFITCSSRICFFEQEIIKTKEKLNSAVDYDLVIFFETKLKLLGAYYKRLLDLIT